MLNYCHGNLGKNRNSSKTVVSLIHNGFTENNIIQFLRIDVVAVLLYCSIYFVSRVHSKAALDNRLCDLSGFADMTSSICHKLQWEVPDHAGQYKSDWV